MKIRCLLGESMCFAVLVLAACGGGGGDAPPPPATITPVSTTAVSGLATKGPIKAGTVKVFAIRNGIIDAVPLGQAQTDDKGNYTVETFGYTGPVLVEVTGGTYTDEISGTLVALKTPLRSIFSSAAIGTTTMAVTPLSELAAKLAEGGGGLTADGIDAANRSVAAFFKLINIVTSLPSSLGSSTDDQKNYAASLGAFSQLVIDSMRAGDWAAGQTMDNALVAVMTHLGNEISQTGGFSPDSLAKINLAQTLFSAGGTTAPPPTTTPPPPPPPPAGGVVKFGTAGTTTDIINSIIMTVTLPVGVTVEVAPGTNIAANISVTRTPFSSAKETLTAFVTQATLTTPGKIDIQVQDPRGIPLGQFLTINFKMDPAGTFPASASNFSATGVAVQGKVATLTGIITVSPLSLAVL